PLTLFAIEKYFNKRNMLMLTLLPIGFASSFFSGHIQTSIYLTIFTFAFLMFKLMTTKNIKAFSLSLCFFFLGIGISLLQIIPTLNLYKESGRSQIFSNEG